MASTTAFRETTFRPAIDKWSAKDGATVVLWADPDEILLLRHATGQWEVTRHPAVEPSAHGNSGAMKWLGVCYAAAGARIAAFSADSPISEWESFYAECQERQRPRYRTFLVSSSGGEAALS